MEAFAIVCKAVEHDLPSCVTFYASMQFVDILGIIASPPFHCQNRYFLVFGFLSVVFPGYDLKWSRALVVRSFDAGVIYDLFPAVLDGFFFLAQLPQDVSKVDLRLFVVGSQFKCLLTIP